MKRISIAALLLFASFASAQRIPQINLYSGDPTGTSCSYANSIVQSQTTGAFYTCVGGVYLNPIKTVPLDTRPNKVTSAEYITVPANSTYTLSTSPTGPGTITHVHLTWGPTTDNLNIEQNSLLIFVCDGVTRMVDTGTFFAGLDNPTPFVTDTVSNMLGNNGIQSASSANRRTEINFQSGCTVTYVNPSNLSSVLLFGEVSYRMGTVTSRPSRQYWYANTTPLTNVVPLGTLTLLPTVTSSGGGELESETLWADSTSEGYIEGDPFVNADGALAVTANGTEDFFGCGYACRNGVGGIHADRWGVFYASGIQAAGASLQNPNSSDDMLFYRFFNVKDADNVLFTSTLQTGTYNGHSGQGSTNVISGFRGLATFWTNKALASNTLTLSTSGAGTGVLNGINCQTGSYVSGQTITCTATPNTGGSTFIGWSGTGSAPSSAGGGTISFQLTSNSTLTANFGTGGGAFAHVSSCASPAESATSQTSVSCTSTMNISAGATVFCGVRGGATNAAPISLTDGTNTNIFIPIPNTSINTTFGNAAQLFASIGTKAESNVTLTGTFNIQAQYLSMTCEQFSGIHGFDISATTGSPNAVFSTGTTGTALSTPNIATHYASELLFAWGGSFGGSTFTAGSGYTILQNNAGNDSGSEWQTLSSTTTSINATMTNSQSDPWYMALVGMY